jgi:ribosomal protein S18 acetylase RimI-like enzyme
MDISIRTATPDDYDALCGILQEIDALHKLQLPDVFRDYPKPIWPKKFLIETLKDKDKALFLAERGGRMVGFLRALIRTTPDLPFLIERRFAFIDTLVVTESARRTGVGKALMERVHHWAAEKNLTQVRLNVWEFNEGAVQFYEKLGYVSKTREMWRSLPSDPREKGEST